MLQSWRPTHGSHTFHLLFIDNELHVHCHLRIGELWKIQRIVTSDSYSTLFLGLIADTRKSEQVSMKIETTSSKGA